MTNTNSIICREIPGSSWDRRSIFFCSEITAAFMVLVALPAAAQTANTPPTKEFWSELNTTFELGGRNRLQTTFEKHNAEDVLDHQWKFGAVVSHRMKRIVQRRRDPDEETKYNLVIGAGYEYLKAGTGHVANTEHRLLVQSTPNFGLGLGFLLQDRNRLEFRWIAGTFDFRYRNRLTIDRPLRLDNVRFIPYARGELFWDRNHHSWNANQYRFGVQWPYRKILGLDTFYLHQNCTTCGAKSINAFGLALNIFLNWPKRL